MRLPICFLSAFDGPFFSLDGQCEYVEDPIQWEKITMLFSRVALQLDLGGFFFIRFS